MRLQDIQNLSFEEWNSMSRDELASVVKDATRITKQRVSYFTRRNISSPAVMSLDRNIGIHNLPNESRIDSMNVNSLKRLFTREQNFLTSQTSTLTGERQRLRNIAASTINTEGMSQRQAQIAITRRVNQMGGEEGLRNISDMVEQIREMEPAIEYMIGSDPPTGVSLFALVTAAMIENPDATYSDVMEFLQNELDRGQRARREEFEFS